MPTSRDVAQIARVSQATVSRVISNGPVSEATRQRVLKAMEQTGYVPDLGARAMRTGRVDTIGVVIDDLANPFYPTLLDALTSALDSAGEKVTLWTSNGKPNDAALQAIASRSVDGVIFTTVTENSPTLRAALKRKSPVVLVHRGVEGLACDQVTSNNFEGGRTAAEFLIGAGHREFALIGASDVISTSRDRRRGFQHRLESEGISMNPNHMLLENYTYEFGFSSATALFAEGGRPTALFCTNDVCAMGAIDAVRELGIRVPDDLWVVGFDDVPMASWKSYNLTTIRQPIDELGSIATRLMLERLAHPSKPVEKVMLECAIVQRSTTG